MRQALKWDRALGASSAQGPKMVTGCRWEVVDHLVARSGEAVIQVVTERRRVLGGWLWYRVETLVAPEDSAMTSSMGFGFVPDALNRGGGEEPLDLA